MIEANEGFWDFIRDTSEAFVTDVVLSDGDVIAAGGRDLRILARPGHSTTDALLVDERSATAFVGDHLLAGISSNAEIVPAAEPTGSRPRARIEYLGNLRRTASMPLERAADRSRRCPSPITRRLVLRRFASTGGGASGSSPLLDEGPAQAYGIARHLWSARTVAEQPLLVVWEVLGHLDLLLDDGTVSEQILDDGSRYGKAWFSLREPTDIRRDGPPRTGACEKRPSSTQEFIALPNSSDSPARRTASVTRVTCST